MSSLFSVRLSGLLLFVLYLFGLTAQAGSDPRFIGLRHALAAEIVKVLPESAHRVTFLDFASPLCLDCQKMKPVLKQFRAQHPNVYFRAVDVIADRSSEAALLRTFKPLTVPALVVLDSHGEIRDVLYNYQPLNQLNNVLGKVQPAAGLSPAHSAPASQSHPVKKHP